MHTVLKQAELTWPSTPKDNVPSSDSSPVSSQFDDVYFTGNFISDSALACVDHVFFKPNKLNERFLDSRSDEVITILETGFGSGLNFFACFDKWRQVNLEKNLQKDSPAASGILRFISTELYPLRKEDFKKLHLKYASKFDSSSSEFFIKNYPLNIEGQYSFYFPKERVQLVLCYGDALNTLKTLNTEIDCFFLDGFSPSKNKDLWSKELFMEFARLAKPSSTLGSFSVAGWVRRNLESAGFIPRKVSGFAPKKYNLEATFKAETEKRPKLSSLKLNRKPPKVLIIGSGFAGCSLSYSLSKYGLETEILEKGSSLAPGASGNKLAIAAHHISNQKNFINELYFLGIENFFNTLSSLKMSSSNKDFHASNIGAIQLLSRKRLDNIYENNSLNDCPKDLLQIFDQKEVFNNFGLNTLTGAFILNKACYLSPADYCSELLKMAQTKITFNTEVSELKNKKNIWEALNEQGEVLAEAEYIVLANAASVNQFSQTNFLGLESIRGQVLSFNEVKSLNKLDKILCFDGYLTPSIKGMHFLGATYAHGDLEKMPRKSDNRSMLSSLKKYFPDFSLEELPSEEELLKNSRVSFRASTYDRVPFVGEVPKEKNLYVSAGFGSRGLSTSGLAAEIIAEDIYSKAYSKNISSYSRYLTEGLAPARYLKSRKYRRECN